MKLKEKTYILSHIKKLYDEVKINELDKNTIVDNIEFLYNLVVNMELEKESTMKINRDFYFHLVDNTLKTILDCYTINDKETLKKDIDTIIKRVRMYYED